MTERKNQLAWLWLAIATVIIDQIGKFWIVKSYMYGSRAYLMPFINIVLAHNEGAAFGMLRNAAGWQHWFFIIVAILVSIVIVSLLAKTPRVDNWSAAGMALILGGAIGNLYDRVVLGYVVDFVDLHLGSIHFPAYFNIADVAINVGILLWIIGALFCSKQN